MAIRVSRLLIAVALAALLPAPLASAKGGRGKSTSPACPLKCPAGYTVSVYTWELHPERTNYDETGKAKIADDSLWPVTCALKCEQRVPNQETKVWKDSKPLCKSGFEPSPYHGPWRITGQWSRECAATANNGCTMSCYPAPVAKPARGGKGKASPAKK